MQSLETKSSRPKSFETETRPETFETETQKTGLETCFETETKSRDSITVSHIHKSRPTMLQEIYFLVFVAAFNISLGCLRFLACSSSSGQESTETLIGDRLLSDCQSIYSLRRLSSSSYRGHCAHSCKRQVLQLP